MNAKKCKALRRKAREMMAGVPERLPLQAIVHEKRAEIDGKDIKWTSQQAIVHPRSMRAEYRRQKKAGGL